MNLKAPFPFFGAKTLAAPLIWARFGCPRHYIEPFAGSLAVLLNRPDSPGIETVNDLDGLLVNVWRALAFAPDEVAHYADWPVTELDLVARHRSLVAARKALTQRLSADPEFCDPKLAGWWVWGAVCWIGGDWCRAHTPAAVSTRLPKLSRLSGGVASATTGSVLTRDEGLSALFERLSRRLRHVRVACGDFERVLTPSLTERHGLCAVLLDPPYDGTDAHKLYHHADAGVGGRARAWAVENGDNPNLRIALCGYEQAPMPPGWTQVRWHARRGYQKAVSGQHSGQQETIWFSPACLQGGLF